MFVVFDFVLVAVAMMELLIGSLWSFEGEWFVCLRELVSHGFDQMQSRYQTAEMIEKGRKSCRIGK